MTLFGRTVWRLDDDDDFGADAVDAAAAAEAALLPSDGVLRCLGEGVAFFEAESASVVDVILAIADVDDLLLVLLLLLLLFFLVVNALLLLLLLPPKVSWSPKDNFLSPLAVVFRGLSVFEGGGGRESTAG